MATRRTFQTTAAALLALAATEHQKFMAAIDTYGPASLATTEARSACDAYTRSYALLAGKEYGPARWDVYDAARTH